MKFIHKIPTFTPGPLKKEILLTLRDMSYAEQSLRYAPYSDGILYGCRLFEENMHIGLCSGIVKYADRIYLLSERASVPYEHTDDWTVLKLRFGTQIPAREYLYFSGELVLDANTQTLPNELEMGRFKLKKGSSLRTEYKDFYDMQTEYDTVNLLHVRQAGLGGATLSPEITSHFAREAYAFIRDNPLDAAFCTEALRGEALARELIERYVSARLGNAYRHLENEQLFDALEETLRLIRGASAERKRPQNSGVRLFD